MAAHRFPHPVDTGSSIGQISVARQRDVSPTHSRSRRIVRRVRTGCLTCRARKVKCDESPGGCNNCRLRQLRCDFTPSDLEPDLSRPLSPLVSSVTRRLLACQQCRVARCKCSRTLPCCIRCSRMDLQCIYPESKNGSVGLSPAARARIEAANTSSKPREISRRQSRTSEDPGLLTLPLENDSDDISVNVRETIVATTSEAGIGSEARHVSIVSDHGTSDDVPSSNPTYQINQIDRPVLSDHDLHPVPRSYRTTDGESTSLPVNLEEYVDAFFDYIAPYQANGFLHRGSLKQQIYDNEAPAHLLLAICAIAARFVPNSSNSIAQNTQHQSSHWAWLATKRLMASYDINVTNASVALLLCKNATYNGAFNHAFLLASLANRYVLRLRLFDENRWPNPPTVMRWVEKEERRRLMFACYCVDRMTASGMKELSHCPADIIRIRLPCEEHSFDFGIPCEPPFPILEGDGFCVNGEKCDPAGVMGYFTCLVGIRYIILSYIESLSGVSATPPWSIGSDYQLSLRKLSAWATHLPESLRLTRENLFSRHNTPHLGPMVMLHLWNDMLHCELYRLALQTHSDPNVQAIFDTAPAGWISETQDLCLYHAVNIAKTLQMVENDLSGEYFTILDPSLAMLCYASMKMQLLYSSMRESLGLDSGISDETIEGFQILLMFVERLSKYFKPTAVLLREMKRTLQRSGISGPWSESTIPTSGSQTPEHPWLARLKPLNAISPDLNLHGAFDDIALFRDMMPDIGVNVDFWTYGHNPFI